MALLLNRVRVATATTGTGALSLGSAASGYQGFSAAGAVDGSRYSYVIEDGTAWEIGEGVYTASGPSLSRNLVASSTGAPLNLSGSASVFVSPLVGDLLPKPNTTATRAPTVTDDASQGYAIGSRWRYNSRSIIYECEDATVGAARWRIVFHMLMPYSDRIGGFAAHAGGSGVFSGFNSVTTSGTLSLTTPAGGPLHGDYATSATANNEARLVTSFGNTAGIMPIVPAIGGPPTAPLRAVKMTFGFPDTSYGSGSTGVRFFAGAFGSTAISLDNSAGSVSTSGIGGSLCAFRYDTSAGDTNIQFVGRPTAQPTDAVVVDTGIPFIAGDPDYEASLLIEGPGSLRWILRRPFSDGFATGVFTGGSANGFASAYNFTAVGFVMRTLDAVARNFRYNTISVMERPA